MPSTWRTALPLLLKQLTSEAGRSPRLAVLGIGNLMRCDDAAGMLVARALSQHEAADSVLVLEAGPAPENQTAELRKFAPDLVLLVDAADMDKAPGAVDWVSEEDIDGMSASTHSLPLSMLVKFLSLDLGCKVKLLGIQAASNEVGETVSAKVLEAVKEVVNGLDEVISAKL